MLAATGPAAPVKFLHGMLSNDLAARAPGQGCLSSLMDVKGHLLCFFRVLVTPDALLLEMPADRLDFVTRDRSRTTAWRRPCASRGAAAGGPRPARPAGARTTLRARGRAEVPTDDAEAHVDRDHRRPRGARRRAPATCPADGYALHARPSGGRGAVRAALGGAVPLDRATLDVLRIEDGRPGTGRT